MFTFFPYKIFSTTDFFAVIKKQNQKVLKNGKKMIKISNKWQ